MSDKIGRNKPCWCGSGKKYKKCHYEREHDSPVSKQEILTNFKGFYKKYCLHPDNSQCKGDIIRAHVIQRNGGLSQIARDGHVYHFEMNLLDPASPLLQAKKKGVSSATTFTGFCSYHDKETFKPIEDNPFQNNNLEHLFLLAYRGLCRELYTKKNIGVDSDPFFRTLDRGKTINEQKMIQQYLDWSEAMTKAGLEDLDHQKTLYDNALLAHDFSDVQYYAINIQNTPEIMCCGTDHLRVDFNGNVLQDINDPKLKHVRLKMFSFSIIGTDSGGTIVFSWLGTNKLAEQLITSLHKLSEQDIPHAIVRYAFEYFENIVFSPDWWENLDKNTQQKLTERASQGGVVERPSDCLKDDGLRLVSWKIVSKETNLIL
jgi:hypothetical protein